MRVTYLLKESIGNDGIFNVVSPQMVWDLPAMDWQKTKVETNLTPFIQQLQLN